MANPILFSGNVIKKSGEPIPDARISFVSSPGSMPDVAIMTDKAGKFLLSVPEEGKYTIGISADEYEYKEVNLDIKRNEKLNITIEL